MKTDQNKFDAMTALAMGSAVALGVLLAAATVHAETCAAVLGNINYTAAFTIHSQAMKLVVGTATIANAAPQMLAQIFLGKDCQAVCHVKAFERNENTLAPVSMDLDCQATRFRPALNAPATLSWATSVEGDPEIRIGTWLGGYEKSALKVELDNYKNFVPADRMIARAN